MNMRDRATNVKAEDFINDAMMNYSAYTLLNRALPDFRDGLKPVHRRIITSLYLNNTKNFIKSATAVGRVMQIHPHGDTYDTFVGMTQKDRQNIPFLEGKGSWGHYTSKEHQAAAARYTEVKLGQTALEMTKELKNNCVDTVLNYDGTIEMPEVLPVTFPVILTHYNKGIATGFASETLSYNLLEIYDNINKYVETGELDVLVPDFPTGGFIIKNEQNFENIWNEGNGGVTIRAKAQTEKGKIIINEIPYGEKRDKIIENIINLAKTKKIPEITDVRDGTSLKGMKIVIKLKKNADPDLVLEKLYQSTRLQANVNANNNIIFNGTPTVMGSKQILLEWMKWRKSIIKVSVNNSISKKKEKLNIYEGLEKIVDDLDNVINIIRFTDDSKLMDTLKSKYELNDEQATYVVGLPLRSINETRLHKSIKEIKNLRKEIKQLEKDVKSDDFLNEKMLKTMKETIDKLNIKERKSKIIEIDKKAAKTIKKVKKEISSAESYPVNIIITKNGYVYKSKKSGEFASTLRVDDEILQEVESDNSSRLFSFLPNGEGGLVTIDDIDEKNGIHLSGYFGRDKSYGAIVKQKDLDLVLICYEDGQVVKIPFESFMSARNTVKNGYYKQAKPVLIKQIKENDKLSIKATSGKRSKTFDSDFINIKKGHLSRGQNIIKPKEGEVVSFEILS